MKLLNTALSGLLLTVMPLSAASYDSTDRGVWVPVPEGATATQIEELAVQVRPSYRQIDYQQREMLGFIHIGMNTFTGREWGDGKEDPSIFNPSELDADEWIRTFKDTGVTAVIFVAKHHDGFCMWPSKYTDHTVAASPWRGGKGDMVREVADACHRHDMKLCIYLSPWDMHEPTYGTEAYNDYYIHQIEELLTNYGPVYLLWFDGAGTDSATSGKDMPFDWERIFTRARELQPDVILSGNAPDVRWIGNEMGKGRSTEWSVQGVNEEQELFGSLKGYVHTLPNLGEPEDLIAKKRLVWYPSRGGLPIRKGWFYNARDEGSGKTLDYIVNSYFALVGHNSNVLLNMSPDTTGRFPAGDTARLLRFGSIIRQMKSIDYASGAKAAPLSQWADWDAATLTDADPFSSWHTSPGTVKASLTIGLKEKSTFNVIKLQENIRDFGQRVKAFAIDAYIDSAWRQIGEGTTIGFRRMLRLPEPVSTDSLRVRITDARVSVSLGNVSCYLLPDYEDMSAGGAYINPVMSHTVLHGMEGDDTESLRYANSLWHGKINGSQAAFVFETDGNSSYNAISYLPSRQSSNHIERYAVRFSDDGQTWSEIAASGRFGNVVNNPVEQIVRFPSTKSRYVRIDIIKTVADTPHLEIESLRLIDQH
ncbi:MAG: alpha-L-fucosidase [Roseburia sp.]|nr:alpha-L-fucosidase [Roseburia sp.]